MIVITGLTGNAIEAQVCKVLERSEIRVLTEKEMTMCLNLLMCDRDKIAKDKDLSKSVLFQIINQAIKYRFSFINTDPALVVLLMYLSGTPGVAIMYLWYIQYKCFHLKIKEVNMEVFMRDICPLGVFTDENLDAVWKAQKVTGKPDNMLDYAKFGESILTIPEA